MANNRKEQERSELHRSIWAINKEEGIEKRETDIAKEDETKQAETQGRSHEKAHQSISNHRYRDCNKRV